MVLAEREEPPRDGEPKKYLRGDEFLMVNPFRKKKKKKDKKEAPKRSKSTSKKDKKSKSPKKAKRATSKWWKKEDRYGLANRDLELTYALSTFRLHFYS